MKLLHSLNRLVDVREREVDRLQAAMADQEATRQRYRNNLERLEELSAGSGVRGSWSPLLAANSGAYKQNVLLLAAAHRESLAAHEADMAVTRVALQAAARRHEVLAQVRDRQLESDRRALQRREQKGQDELAAQVWLRGRG